MELLAELAAWFTDPANWQGNDAIPNRLVEHIRISLAAVLAAVILAIPLGLLIGHTGRGSFIAISLANIGRAVPSYAVLVILFPLSIAFARQTGSELALLSTFLAMVMLAIPPIVTNTYIGLREVDRDLVEAARGMGMRGSQVLSRVEIPIALPVILAGLRTASVQVVATATLGAVLGGGGLGRYIVQGMARREYDRLLAGALMVALLAIATELFFSWLQRRTISAGLAARGDGGDASDQAARARGVRSPAA